MCVLTQAKIRKKAELCNRPHTLWAAGRVNLAMEPVGPATPFIVLGQRNQKRLQLGSNSDTWTQHNTAGSFYMKCLIGQRYHLCSGSCNCSNPGNVSVLKSPQQQVTTLWQTKRRIAVLRFWIPRESTHITSWYCCINGSSKSSGLITAFACFFCFAF